MSYRTDTACLTTGCEGTPFFGDTASPGYCDSCHVARMTCPVCRHDLGSCRWDGEHPTCPDCHEPIMGARWNRGRCLECHEDALLPW